jgi:hypothetical protein
MPARTTSPRGPVGLPLANDEALDSAHELVDRMIEQVEDAVASEHGLEPDSARMMCNVELMWLIGQHAGLSMPEAETVEVWKDKYLAVWDAHIDGLDPEPGYKEGGGRRGDLRPAQPTLPGARGVGLGLNQCPA